MTPTCPECGVKLEHVPYVPGESLEHWACLHCDAIVDISEVEDDGEI
jgi:hypothetical protein